MLLSIRLIPNVNYKLDFVKSHSNPNIAVYAKNGEDIPFLAVYRHEEDRIVLNDYYNKTWGAEIYVSVPAIEEARAIRLNIKFNGQHLEASTDAQATKFDRFDASRHELAQFARLQGVEDPDNALAFSPPSLESTLALIDHRLLERRIRELEQKVEGLERLGAKAKRKD